MGQEQAACPLHRPGCSAHPRACSSLGNPGSTRPAPAPGPSACTHSTHCSRAAQGSLLGIPPRQSTEMLPPLSQQALCSRNAQPVNTECLLKESLTSGSVHFTC